MQPYRVLPPWPREFRCRAPGGRASTFGAVKIRNGSIELHVAEDGDPSAPPILLLHGITSFGGTWDWIVPTLAKQFRVLRLDFRGHGASDRAPGEYTTDGYVSDAVAAIEQVAGAPCIVMGHSLGGATAAMLAQRHADLVVAAVMEDPPLGVAGNSPEGVLEGNSLLDSFRLMRESVPQMQAAGIALAALANPYGAIYCHETAHINVYECGAPEFFTGAKLVGLPGRGYKLWPDALDEALGEFHAPIAQLCLFALSRFGGRPSKIHRSKMELIERGLPGNEENLGYQAWGVGRGVREGGICSRLR